MLIMQRQNQWVAQTNVVLEYGFNIFTNVKYTQVKYVGDEAIMQTFDVSFGKIIKKFSRCISHLVRTKDVGASNLSTNVSRWFEFEVQVLLHEEFFHQKVL